MLPIGINFLFTSYTIDPSTLARAVEDAGFDSLWVPDHPVLPAASNGEYARGGGKPPQVYGQLADPFISLGFAGAVTERIGLATGVCLVAQRHPLILAKTVSTLDRFASGRVVLGVGAGWSASELELFGVAADDKWAVVREVVDAMRILWRDGRGGFNGRHVSFPDVICDPVPARRPAPPVLVGGAAVPGTFRRVARWSDGWVPVFVSPDQIRAGKERIAEECEVIGRDPNELEITVFVKDVTEATRYAYAEAGADRLVLQLYGHPGTSLPFDTWQEHHVTAGSLDVPKPDETLRALAAVAEMAAL